MTRQQRTIGAVLAVPLGDGTATFALTLQEADFAFFDARTIGSRPPANLLAKPVLFRIAVHKSGWAAGRWPKVSKVSMPSQLHDPQPKFIQDPVHPDRFEIYLAGEIRPSTRAECDGLERAAVWEPEHVEERLRAHYAGVPSEWVQSLQPR